MIRKRRRLIVMAIYFSIAAVLQGCLPYFSVTRYLSTYDECDYYRNFHPVEVNIMRATQDASNKCYKSQIDDLTFGVTSKNSNDYVRGVCLLELAIMNGKFDVMQVLIKNGAALEKCGGDYKLRFYRNALRSKSPGQLLELYPNIMLSKVEMQDLLVEISYSNSDSIHFLMRQGVDPNFKDHRGDTPLHRILNTSIGFHTLMSTQYLLEWGADPNALNMSGKTVFEKSRGKFETLLNWSELKRILEDTKPLYKITPIG